MSNPDIHLHRWHIRRVRCVGTSQNWLNQTNHIGTHTLANGYVECGTIAWTPNFCLQTKMPHLLVAASLLGSSFLLWSLFRARSQISQRKSDDFWTYPLTPMTDIDLALRRTVARSPHPRFIHLVPLCFVRLTWLLNIGLFKTHHSTTSTIISSIVGYQENVLTPSIFPCRVVIKLPRISISCELHQYNLVAGKALRFHCQSAW